MKKENKNKYYLLRKEAGLTRAKASELMDGIPSYRIERIENGSLPYPEEIEQMHKAYKQPLMVSDYCSNDCPLGKNHQKKVEKRDLPQIVLEVLSTLSLLDSEKMRLVEIAKDGILQPEEMDDFLRIRDELNQIAEMSNSLKLWIDEMKLVNK